MIARTAAVLALLFVGAAQAQAAQSSETAANTIVHGPVLQITDAEHIWVATGPARADWVQLLIKGADEAPAQASDRLGPALLMSVAFGKTADCKVRAQANGDKVADCRIEGQPLSDLLRRPGAMEAARSWTPTRRAMDAPLQLASR